MHKCSLLHAIPHWPSCGPGVPNKGQFHLADFGTRVSPGPFQWSMRIVKFTKCVATVRSLHLIPNFDSNGSRAEFASDSTSRKMALVYFCSFIKKSRK